MLKPLNITRQLAVIKNGMTSTEAAASLGSIIGDLQAIINELVGRANDLSKLSKLSDGGLSLDIGKIRNITSRYEFEDPPDIQNVAAAGQQLIVLGRWNRLKNTSGGNLTLTGTPTVAPGKNGQRAEFFNPFTFNIVFQDRGTLANSGLALGANTRTVSPRSSLLLRYSADLGLWVERDFSAVL